MSPLVLVDHFVMTGPTFAPHPHAGISAVTLLFEDSQGVMQSLDSVRNDHEIRAGDLHWTLAGKGSCIRSSRSARPGSTVCRCS